MNNFHSWSKNIAATRVPARLSAAETAKLLGFHEHDIPVLIGAKLLKPLGRPVPNASKFFAACDIDTLTTDSDWLHAATQTVYDYWKRKNKNKKPKVVFLPSNSIAA